jgi:peptidoglycan/xylan/chitin deacetylase (PgdA/CDA1 family)
MILKQTLRRQIARVTPARRPGGVRVLLYHAVDFQDPADTVGLRVSRDAFLKQMNLLRTEGYKVVPLVRAWETEIDNDCPRVAITFDDGYRSQAWAVEVLRDFGFAATLFLVPRFLDAVRTPRWYWEAWEHLGWDEIATLCGNGIDIGAHSVTHADLTACAPEQLEDEVAGSRRVLGAHLDHEILTFSYPHGRHDGRVRRAVERAGYRLACTSLYGDNRTIKSWYTVQRTEVTGSDDLTDFQWKLQGKYDWLAHWQTLRLSPLRKMNNETF